MKVKVMAATMLLMGGALLSACGTTSPTVIPTTGTGATMGTTMEATSMATMGDTAQATMMATTGATMMATMAATTTTGSGTGGAGRHITVSSKNFTEEVILGEMYAQVLENAGVPVDRKLNLGATDLAQSALLKGGANGGIDLYPEYTSTGIQSVLPTPAVATAPLTDPQAIYNAVKSGYKTNYNLVWLDPSPMNDTQAMVTTKAIADQYSLKTLQDLCDKSGQLTVAAVAEFKDRPDALPLLQKTYGGCQFKDIKVFEPNLRYQALINKDVDIAQAFSTDGQISGDNLILLADPKGYGLPYNVAPVVRQDVLDMYPQIAPTLNKLSPLITNDEIQALNWDVDGKGMEAADVAKTWLQSKGLLK